MTFQEEKKHVQVQQKADGVRHFWEFLDLVDRSNLPQLKTIAFFLSSIERWISIIYDPIGDILGQRSMHIFRYGSTIQNLYDLQVSCVHLQHQWDVWRKILHRVGTLTVGSTLAERKDVSRSN